MLLFIAILNLGNIDPCNLGLSQHQDLYIGGSSPHDEFWCLNPYCALDPWLEAWDNLEGINTPFIMDNALAWAFLHSTQVRNEQKILGYVLILVLYDIHKITNRQELYLKRFFKVQFSILNFWFISFRDVLFEYHQVVVPFCWAVSR